ncbi:MAG: hypothetical protein Q9162_006793 [Coniocarpon cinnabarinum]
MSEHQPEPPENVKDSPPVRSINGWDGKLRVGKAELNGTNLESPPQSDNEDPPEETVDGEQINADEDLLDDIPSDETDIDLNHCRVVSIPALHLERFPKLERLCLRQNQVSHPRFPEGWGKNLVELDMYDNAISHVKGLEELSELTSLDLSFNKIKHIKRVNHLKNLKELYFVQNKISTIEELDGLTQLRNLELGANRIREVENLDTLTGLEELWLGKNKITQLKNLTPLINLRLLSIQANRLTSDSLGHLATLPRLKELYISHNALESLEPLASCAKLTLIDASSNPIKSVKGLKPLEDLEELWTSDCQIDSFEEIEDQLRDKSKLTTVYFEGNPVQTRQRALYRNKIKIALPQVIQVDATYVKQA